MNTRRDFLRLGALFVPAAVAPRVAYSFLRARQEFTFGIDPGFGPGFSWWVIRNIAGRILYEGANPAGLVLHERVHVHVMINSRVEQL